MGADADPGRDGDGERVGGANAGGRGPRGDRRRSELRPDVRRSAATGEDRSAGRGGAGGGEPAWLVSRGPSDVGRAAEHAPGAAGAATDRADAERGRRVDPIAGETRWLSAAELWRRTRAGAARRAAVAGHAVRDPGAARPDD